MCGGRERETPENPGLPPRIGKRLANAREEEHGRPEEANQDGPFRTNRVNVESGYSLAPGYDLVAFEQQEIGDTGRLKVLRFCPSDDQTEDPCFLGRWDEKGNSLDFDLVDRQDHVLKRQPYGHHPKFLGDRRFEVELGSDADHIVFRGIVSIALGFRMHLG